MSNSRLSSPPAWFAQAQAILDALENPIEMEGLAMEIGIAPRTLHRHFHRITGKSPQQYRDERRVRTAVELLANVSGIKLRTVAHRIGFADEFYFSRWFKQRLGTAPDQWRSHSGRAASLGPAESEALLTGRELVRLRTRTRKPITNRRTQRN